MFRKSRQSKANTARPLPLRARSEMLEAEKLMEAGKLDEASLMLEELDRQYPNRVEVLEVLTHLYIELNDTYGYEYACERLRAIQPNSPELTLGLAGAYVANGRLALATRTLRGFLATWPDHELSRDARRQLQGLEVLIATLTDDVGLSTEGEDGLDLAVLHEEVQCHLDRGKFPEARRVAERLLRRAPNFLPTLNNLSQIEALEGNLRAAIDLARRVLSHQPDNYHALSNLIRYFCLSGKIDEARKVAGALKAAQSEARDIWLKKAEAFSYLGDDQAVVDALRGAEAITPRKSDIEPYLLHLGAAALARLGDERAAKRYWRMAIKSAPDMDMARQNLQDLEKPVGERHAPWPFHMHSWMSATAIRDLVLAITQTTKGREINDERLEREMRRYLRKHPEIAGIIPSLLERGDPPGREFALRLALSARTPELLEALGNYASSQWGPDDLRQQAGRAVSEAGLLPPGPLRMYVGGEWQDILLMNFEIHDEPTRQLSPRVERLMSEALEALHKGEGARAEPLIQQALEDDPDDPSLLNNLALAIDQQGRREESDSLLLRIHEQHPDYAFACIGVAKLHMRNGELDKAEALLKSLFPRRRWHYSEFRAFFDAQLELYVKQDNLDAAESWLDLWAEVDPESPVITSWRLRLGFMRLARPRSKRKKSTPQSGKHSE